MFRPCFKIPSSSELIEKHGEKVVVKEFYKLLKEYPRKNVLPKYIRIQEEKIEEFWSFFNNLNDFQKSAIFKRIEYVNRPKTDEHPCDWWDHGLDVYYWEKRR